ncbi:MAG: hypothetical protein QXW00_03055 [Candidatus Woesearchaeota archaeon]
MAFSLFGKKDNKQSSMQSPTPQQVPQAGQQFQQIPEPPEQPFASQPFESTPSPFPEPKQTETKSSADEYDALFKKYYPSQEPQEPDFSSIPGADNQGRRFQPFSFPTGTLDNRQEMPSGVKSQTAYLSQQSQISNPVEPATSEINPQIKRELDTAKPIFLKVDKYKAILRELSTVKSIIKSANSSLQSLRALKENEDAELENWRAKLEDIERKLIYVDDQLFGNL